MSRIQNNLRDNFRGAMVFGVIGLSVFLLLKLIGYGPYAGTSWKRTEAQQRQVLYHTDHVALLAACRQLLKQHKEDKNYPFRVEGKIPDEALRLPVALRRLNPTWVDVQVQYQVRIELGGGFFHHGFIAQAEDAEEDYASTPVEGYRKLLPGLWYYAEDNHIPPE